MTPESLATALVVVLVPGTGVIYTLATGLGQGKRAAVAAAFGCTLRILPAMLAAITGLAAVLHAYALAFQIVKWAGVAFLLHLAWGTLKEHGAFDVSPDRARQGYAAIATKAVLLNTLNPKLSIFFLAFLPQFLSGDPATATAEMAGLGAVFMGLTFVVFLGYGVFAAAARNFVLESPRIMAWARRAFAATFAGLGLKLTLERT